MLTKYVKIGNKVELQPIRSLENNSENVKKVYQSIVQDISSDDRIEITMPLEKTKLVLLPIGMEMELIFYTKKGLFQCFGRIADRYKSNNIYILEVEITSNLKKHQRREYYRYNCTIDIWNRNLVEAEWEALKNRQPLPDMKEEELEYDKNIIVDISGGGARFISGKTYDTQTLIFCKFFLPHLGKTKEYMLMAKVLTSTQLENRDHKFEHRVQFVTIRNETREEIIKFIFEEERKNRRKEQGM